MTDTPETSDTPEVKAVAPKGKITITPEAQVMYQADSTNPLPGVVIGALKKGDHVLEPAFEPVAGGDAHVDALVAHLNTVLAPLTALADVADAPQPVQDIAAGLRDGLGIVARADYADQIAALDDSMRSILRAKGVRLGPLFLFCHELNKPAAVGLRGLLYALAHDMALPAPVPAAGVVSKTVEVDDTLRGFYSAISYPVYGPRAVRIDMLDRVVNAVYESADKGKFQAQHSMAEWMGCGIADLYAVLEALGHRKVHDPAGEVAAEAVDADAPEEAAEAAPEEPKADAPKAPDAKPILATFALKAGKAAAKGGKVPAKKEFVKKDKPKREKPKGKGKPKPKDNGPRVISADAKPQAAEDSPWAALAALKK